MIKAKWSLFFLSVVAVGCSSSVIENPSSRSSSHYVTHRTEFLKTFRSREATASELALKYLQLDLEQRELEVRYMMFSDDLEASVKEKQKRTEDALESFLLVQDEQEKMLAQAVSKLAPDDAEGVLELSLASFQFEFRKFFGPSSRRWSTWNYRRGDVQGYNKSCVDVVEDQLLGEIADSILTDDRARYVATLAKIIQAIECQPLETAIALDSGLAHAYQATIQRFPDQLQRMVRRALVSSLANVMLAVYDESKIVGLTALTDWFLENRSAIAEAYSFRYSAATLIGLWLREPAGDRLTQVRLCEESESASECVSVGHLVDSVITPYRMGIGNCSASEMLTPLTDDVGYLCQKGICDNFNEDSVLFQQETTQYGAELDVLKDYFCMNGGLTTSGWKEHGGGLTGVGGGIAGAVIACTTESIHNTDGPRKQMKCASDVITSLSTVPFTPTYTPPAPLPCGNPLAADDNKNNSPPSDSRSNDPKTNEKLEQAKKKAENDMKKDESKIIKQADKIGVTVTPDAVDNARASVAAAVAITDEAWIAADKKLPSDSACKGKDACVYYNKENGLGAIGVRESSVLKATMDQLVDLLKHEAGHVMLSNAGVAMNGKLQDAKINEAWQWGKPPKKDHHLLCYMDNTCSSSCSPSWEKFQEFSKCNQTDESPTYSKFRPVTDPSPEDAPLKDTKGAQWLNCFRGRGGLSDSGPIATFCTAMTCSEGIPTVMAGRCQCSSGRVAGGGVGTPTRANPCAWTMCPDGTGGRASSNGTCRCESNSGPPAFPPLPPSPGPKSPERPGDIFPF